MLVKRSFIIWNNQKAMRKLANILSMWANKVAAESRQILIKQYNTQSQKSQAPDKAEQIMCQKLSWPKLNKNGMVRRIYWFLGAKQLYWNVVCELYTQYKMKQNTHASILRMIGHALECTSNRNVFRFITQNKANCHYSCANRWWQILSTISPPEYE